MAERSILGGMMFSRIESSALMDMCRALGLHVVDRLDPNKPDILIVDSESCDCFKLSDYLLATAPVDVKEA